MLVLMSVVKAWQTFTFKGLKKHNNITPFSILFFFMRWGKPIWCAENTKSNAHPHIYNKNKHHSSKYAKCNGITPKTNITGFQRAGRKCPEKQ